MLHWPANQKLVAQFCDPYKVLEHIGEVTHRLTLPDGETIPQVFHMSELKGHIDTPMASLNLPHFATACKLDPLLRVIMDHCCVHDNCQLVKEYLIWWHRLSLDDVM